jgi:hypothetical protein
LSDEHVALDGNHGIPRGRGWDVVAGRVRGAISDQV